MWKILKKAQINWKIFCAHGLEDLILLKWSHYTKQPTDSLPSLSKFQWKFSQIWNKEFWNLCGTTKKKWIAKEILRQNDRRVVLPDFKLYYKAVLIKQYGIAIKMDTKITGTE